MDKKTTIAVVAGIAIVLVVAGGGLIGGLFNNNQNTTATADDTTTMPDTNTQPAQDLQAAPDATQLQSEDVTVGTGTEAVAGDQVTVNYIGELQDGTVFDSSYSRNTPFTFTLGAGQVIQGWDEGVAGMKVGGKRILLIPPALGYGAQAVGPIPANSTLIFQVELLSVK